MVLLTTDYTDYAEFSLVSGLRVVECFGTCVWLRFWVEKGQRLAGEKKEHKQGLVNGEWMLDG